MNTRRATEEEEEIVTAFHEAGHAAANIFSGYFDLKDPAIIKRPAGNFKAKTEFKRVADTSQEPHATNSIREYVRNAYAGRAAENLLSRISAAEGQRIIPDPDSAKDDFKTINDTLASYNMQHERDDLFKNCQQLIDTHSDIVQEIADLILSKGHENVSYQEIYELPSVKKKI